MKTLILASLLVAGTVFAGVKDKADALFNKGKKLAADKRYADACPAFEQSMKLDPAIGTQLNIAKCYEDWGRIGKALVAYRAAEKMAKDANDDRAPKIQKLIEGLEPDVPRLTIKLPKGAVADGIVATLDSEPMTTFGEQVLVDPGPHTIEYSVDGGPKKLKTVPIERGGDSEVTLDVPKDRVVKKADDEEPETPTAPGRKQRMGGIALAGAGVIAIGVSTVMTVSAKGKYDDALEMHCMGATNLCGPMGLELTHGARSTANTATIVFVVGAAAVGGGVALYLLAPKAEQYVVPSATTESVGVVYGGRF